MSTGPFISTNVISSQTHTTQSSKLELGQSPLRFGILGAAPIAVNALIRPARALPEVLIAAVAARDPARAQIFARQHGIARVHESYAALLADPTIDAVYIPLPNSLHAPWGIRALQTGKHVLCEKPLAANAHDAALMAQAAASANRVLAEAFHYRYHPLAARLQAIIGSGELGHIWHIETEFSVPLLKPHSIQFRYDLAGGAGMDVGCYAMNLLRMLANAEPRVLRASARLLRPQVDRLMGAELAFAAGCSGRMTCALLSSRLLRASASVYGSDGELYVNFPFLPHYFHHIAITARGRTRREQIRGTTTYSYQLRAFVEAVRTGVPLITSPTDAVANMRAIDACYMAAGLALRQSTPPS